MAWLNIGTNDNQLATTNTNDRLTRLPKQFIWESNSPQKFRAALQSRDIQRLIHDFRIDSGSDRNINTSLDAVENIILTTAKRCLKIKVIKNDMLDCLLTKRIMFTVGSVGRHYRSVLSVNTRSICRPSTGRHISRVSVECQPSIGRVSVEYRSSIGRYVGRYSTDTRSTSDRYSNDTRPISFF